VASCWVPNGEANIERGALEFLREMGAGTHPEEQIKSFSKGHELNEKGRRRSSKATPGGRNMTFSLGGVKGGTENLREKEKRGTPETLCGKQQTFNRGGGWEKRRRSKDEGQERGCNRKA